ncbi:hypothetical protein JNM05_08440 [bacterium]|nr:hypothetical protein [bacterium]
MLKSFCICAAGIFLFNHTVAAQDISKDLAKLDPFTASATLDNLGKTHYGQLVKEHEVKLAELAKTDVVIIKADVVLSVEKPVKIAFAWPVSYGQKLADKSNIKRDPYIMTLYPGKDSANKDVAQKWQISYVDGSVKAIQ